MTSAIEASGLGKRRGMRSLLGGDALELRIESEGSRV
jgi:hypothetical protein